jgi:hypothetical protein
MRGWLGAAIVGCLVLSGCTSSSGSKTPEPQLTATTASPSRLGPMYKVRLLRPSVRADVDGDGQRDLVQLWMRKNVMTKEWRQQARVYLADGESTATPWRYSWRSTMDRLQGRGDVDGDGDDEVVVYIGGNTSFSATLLTYAHERLVYVHERRHPKHTALLYFGFHGNTCGPCTGDTTCQPVEGRPRVVLSESHYLTRRGRPLTPYEMFRTHDETPLAEHERSWTARIYALRGRLLHLVEKQHGVAAPGEPLPAAYAFDGNLRCGTAFWSLGEP